MTINRASLLGNVRRVGAVITIVAALCALSALAQTAKDVKGATPLVAVPNEPSPKLIVDPPIPEQLALGRVFDSVPNRKPSYPAGLRERRPGCIATRWTSPLLRGWSIMAYRRHQR